MRIDRQWRERAACRGMGAEGVRLFLPQPAPYGRGLSAASRACVAEAVKICARCPVRADCLMWAVTIGEHSGVWGGRYISERDLPKLRRQLREQPGSFAA